jgi:hypothetical protein
MLSVCFAEGLLSEALLVAAVAVAGAAGDDLELVVEVLGVVEAALADAAASGQLAREASVVFVTWAVHFRLSSLSRHIGPLPGTRGYPMQLKVEEIASFYFYEKWPGGETARMEAMVPTSLATRGLVLSAMFRTVYFFQRRERGEGSSLSCSSISIISLVIDEL